MKAFKFLMFWVVFMSLTSKTYAQEKAEKEESIAQKEVAEEALDFIRKANFEKKVRWYREYGLESESLEAKVKFKKHLYSIEFDHKGTLEDIEQKLRFRKLPRPIKDKINEGIASRFDKFKVLKTQIQWAKNPSALIPFFNNQGDLPMAEGYELEIEGFLDGEINTYEVTCTSTGTVYQVLKYVTRPTDNLDF